MDRQRVRRKRKSQGAVLALMVMLILILSLTSLALIRIGQEARIRTLKNMDAVTARFAADAGIERAVYQMNRALQDGTWTLDDVPTFDAEDLTACDGEYTVTFTGNLGSGYEITSVGQSGKSTKTVRVTVELTSPFADNYAILTKGKLGMKAKSTVSGYHSSDPSETVVAVAVGTLSAESGMVDLKNGAVVEGDVYVGVDGDPEQVVDVKDSSSVQGEIFTMAMTYDFPDIIPPDYMASRGAISGSNLTLNTSDSGKYDEIDIDTKGKLEIDGDVTLYITGDITLDNESELVVKTGSCLKLYFDGDIEAKNGSSITNEAEIPFTIQLYGTGSDQAINLKNGSDLYAVVYAPDAVMVIDNNADAYGAFIVDEFEMVNSGDVYYDKALQETSLYDEGIYFSVIHWEEL